MVESSPPATEEPHTNGEQSQQPADDVPEIGESQSSSQALPGAAEADQLFVTEHTSPTESGEVVDNTSPTRSGKIFAGLQSSVPPSSYLAGEYEPVSSSQVATDSEPPALTQPEESQYVPDPVDTSNITNDTTEISAVLTTPSQPPRSAPVASAYTPSGLVADSQTLPGSSSYEPSGTAGTNQTDSAATEAIDTSAEILPVSTAESAVHESEAVVAASGDSTAESQQQSSADENLASSNRPSQAHQAAHQENSQQSIEDQIVETSETAAEQSGPQQSSADRSIGVSGQGQHVDNSTQDKTAKFQADNNGVQDEIAKSQHRPERPAAETRCSLSPPDSGGAPVPNSTLEPTSAQVNGDVDRTSLHTAFESQGEGTAAQEQSKSSALSDSQIHQSRSSSRPAPRRELSESAQATPKPNLQVNPGVSAVNGLTNHIDLTTTTQEPPTSLEVFSLTPPPPNVLRGAQQAVQPIQPTSSDWQSSCPFQTQLPQSNIASALTNRSEGLETRSQPILQNNSVFGEQRANSSRPSSARADNPAETTSSPILRVPSHSIAAGPFGDSAPLKPIASSSPPPPSNHNMENQATPSPKLSTFDKIKAMREGFRRELAIKRGEMPASTSSPAPEQNHVVQNSEVPAISQAGVSLAMSSAASEAPISAIPPKLASPLLFARDGWRSPSAVPHLEPLPVITQEEMNTAGRYDTLLPQAQEYGSNSQQNGSLTPAAVQPIEASEHESETSRLYTIPVCMVGPQRDHYPNTVYFYRDKIKRFLEQNDPDQELIAKLNSFVERMRRITMHMDLDNSEVLTQYDVEPSFQADWDVKVSAKFRFLADLFHALKDQNVTIAVVALPGKVIDMLGTLLQGQQIPYRRLGGDSPAIAEGEGSAKAILLPLDASIQVPRTEKADLVIGMENLVRHDDPSVRSLRQRGDSWAPFVSLVVPRTVEHIERCLSPDLSDRAKSRALVSGIFQYRNDAGRLEDSQQSSKDIAKAVAEYLAGGGENSIWPIAQLSLLQDLGSQTESEIGTDGATPAPTSNKRSREPEDATIYGSNLHKRARMALHSTAEGDITHISDSLDKTTQSNDSGKDSEELTKLRGDHERVKKLLLQALDRVEEHQQSLADLQYRHEEQRNKLVEAVTERDAAVATAQQAVLRMTDQSNAMTNLRSKRSELEAELKEARDRLLDHSVPERAEFEALRLTAAQAKADKEEGETRIAQVQKDLEYVRGLYQSSSSTAQELATQNRDLENQNAVLQNRASGEQVKLRQMSSDTFTKNLRNDNRKLKTMMKDKDAAIKFKDEEISRFKEAGRGRMGTRGTSVPRSPRIGSPMKMDRRIGSRQTSPATGELRGRSGLLHPLRNAEG